MQAYGPSTLQVQLNAEPQQPLIMSAAHCSDRFSYADYGKVLWVDLLKVGKKWNPLLNPDSSWFNGTLFRRAHQLEVRKHDHM